MLKILRRRKNERQVDKLLNNYELPSFSTPVMNVLSKLRDPNCPVQELAADLKIDPGLHVKVLRTVNSVSFGLSHKVSSLDHAVTLLGRSRLESLVLSVGVKESLDRGQVPEWFDMQSFWLSAARRATLARELARVLHPQTQAEAFTAGLLQDMAVPVMAALKGESYRALYQQWQEAPESDLADLEEDEFHLAHPQLGAGIARLWEFPDLLVKTVDSHHQAEKQEIDLAVRITAMVTDVPAQFDTAAFAARISDETGLNRQMLEDLLITVEAEAAELATALS